jgi:hypothetical protein
MPARLGMSVWMDWWQNAGKLTVDRLLGKEVVRHKFHAVDFECLLEYRRPILKNDSSFQFRKGLLQSRTLRAITATDINEHYIFSPDTLGDLFVKSNCVKPRREHRELCFHKSVESALLQRVRLHPRVKVFLAVLPYLESGNPWLRIAKHFIQGNECRGAVVMAV